MDRKYAFPLLILISIILVTFGMNAQFAEKSGEGEFPNDKVFENINTQEECETNNGLWLGIGIYIQPEAVTYKCFQKLPDFGKRCTDSSQCLGNCIAEWDEAGTKHKKMGKCSETTLGGCHTPWTMENGVPTYYSGCAAI